MFSNLKASHEASVECMKNGAYKFGSCMYLGTGGDMEGGGTVDARDMFYNPDVYDMIAFKDDWENKGKISYFVPAYRGLNQFKDKNGNTQVAHAKDYLEKNNWVFQTHGKDAGPALNYIHPQYEGKFGLIAPYSKDFCKSCNRLRITAKGDLRLCLFGNTGINIRHLMQKDSQIDELKDLILKQLNFKKESHYLEIGETGLTKNLSTTGG